MVNGNEHVQNDIPKWVRVVAAAIGTVLLSVMALILGGVAADSLSGGSESWFTLVSMVLFAALTGVIGAQLVYLAVTGKRASAARRWDRRSTRQLDRYGRMRKRPLTSAQIISDPFSGTAATVVRYAG